MKKAASITPRHPLIGSLALLLPLCSQAQSAYTVTTLRSPTTYAMEATDMDNTGKVVGQTSVLALAVTDTGSGLLTPTLKARQQGATWSANTASSITGSKTANYYVPYRIGESGVTLGYKTSVTEQVANGQLFSDQGGINKSGAVALSAYKSGSDEQYRFGSYAVVLSAGTVSILERPNNPWNLGGSYAHSINDQGMVAGTLNGYITEVTEGVDYNIQAAVWTNGKLSWVGPLQTQSRALPSCCWAMLSKPSAAMTRWSTPPT